ncbi:hypothetical protein O53_3718 [Microcystis aeruginosa TAIHU98]|uniref:Uncharacterized protein n=1 Tax=Microcystis aeruginosa TAIHU98 TaxID=1134457 RepID=L7E9D3_MICAE|nr:hypothetical protein O53_3718 [Microcystis aeruginosa TAIHU98]ODV38121.1 hypothetical protein BFG60_2453 [Microcystis aeruginosa NIES-98]
MAQLGFFRASQSSEPVQMGKKVFIADFWGNYPIFDLD